MIKFFNNIQYLFVLVICCCFSTILNAQEVEGEEAIQQAETEQRFSSGIKEYLLREQINLGHVKPLQLEALEALIRQQMESGTETELGDSNYVEENSIFLKTMLEQLFPVTPKIASVYGHQIFKDSISIFSPTSVTSVSDAYILGVGDKISISIFGASQYDAIFEVKKNGAIQPDGMPKIFLQGLNWGRAKKIIEDKFKVYYLFRSEQFLANLSKPRTVLVNILGEVSKPGSYNLVATNTAFNALITAGGPTKSGSVRQIRLIRGNTIKELDVYELMLNPNLQFDFALEENDIIQIPPAQKIVEIEGAIKRPLKYELKDDEGLDALINFSGGFAANAHKELLQINRYTDTERILLDLDWSEIKQQQFDLKNGDQVFIKAIAEQVTNSVTVEGAVELPGTYALQSTSRITDLLRKARITEQARLDVAFLIRMNPDSTNKLVQINLANVLANIGTEIDLQLQASDRLLIYKQNRYVDPAVIQVAGGGIREPNMEIPFDPDSTVTVQRAILLAGGLRENASDIAYIRRTRPDRSKKYIPIDALAAMKSPEDSNNITLFPNDLLVVFGQELFVDSLEVEITGAVRRPVKLEYSPSLKLKDLLIISGGFKREASLNRIEVFRLETKGQQVTRVSVANLGMDEQFNIVKGDKNFELMPYDEVVVRTIAEYEEPSIVTLNGEVAYPGDYALIKKKETLSSLIERAGGVTVEAFLKGASIIRPHEGKILANLDEVLRKNNKTYDYLLRSGDTISIPKIKDIVTIELENTRFRELGAASLSVSKIGVPYNSGKSAKWYIQEYAGGFATTANKKGVLVEFANGGVKGVKNLLFFRQYPKPEVGGKILVSTKPIKENRKIFKKKNKRLPQSTDSLNSNRSKEIETRAY